MDVVGGAWMPAEDVSIMCNGIFRSPVHRVVTNDEKERISLTIFYSVNGEKDLEPAAEEEEYEEQLEDGS
uniref:Isopenicillin N synthase-like Fe(2+) 2OG dioxygenase domain-containing protein n=1 Tax=Oryza punctata TaxID=4537 RepID=A0A0E0L8I7_ORYPU